MSIHDHIIDVLFLHMRGPDDYGVAFIDRSTDSIDDLSIAGFIIIYPAAIANPPITENSVSSTHSNRVWVYDNEPRNREIVNRISRTIDTGDSVVIWPSHIEEKDINDMVMNGHDVQKLVESNTYSGLEAQLKFATWKKV